MRLIPFCVALAASLLLASPSRAASVDAPPPSPLPDPISAMIQAHGGLERWRAAQALTFDCAFEFGPMAFNDRQTFDLGTRQGFIQSATYRIGSDGTNVWIAPNLDAFPLPARFYHGTPFYFAILPFAMADPGVQLEAEHPAPLDGIVYDIVTATYQSDAGDSPDDSYRLFIHPETQRLHLAVYTVTYPTLAKTDPATGKPPESAIVYREWQTVDGLVLPRHATFHAWSGDALGESRGQIRFTNVAVGPDQPDPALFQRPPDSAIDTSHLK